MSIWDPEKCPLLRGVHYSLLEVPRYNHASLLSHKHGKHYPSKGKFGYSSCVHIIPNRVFGR